MRAGGRTSPLRFSCQRARNCLGTAESGDAESRTQRAAVRLRLYRPARLRNALHPREVKLGRQRGRVPFREPGLWSTAPQEGKRRRRSESGWTAGIPLPSGGENRSGDQAGARERIDATGKVVMVLGVHRALHRHRRHGHRSFHGGETRPKIIPDKPRGFSTRSLGPELAYQGELDASG